MQLRISKQMAGFQIYLKLKKKCLSDSLWSYLTTCDSLSRSPFSRLQAKVWYAPFSLPRVKLVVWTEANWSVIVQWKQTWEPVLCMSIVLPSRVQEVQQLKCMVGLQKYAKLQFTNLGDRTYNIFLKKFCFTNMTNPRRFFWV